jgi:carboxymethylenebutenolidase
MKKELIHIDTPSGPLDVYTAAPDGPAKGGLIVIHEVWGLDDHIKDVADRFAAAGYFVAAPNLLAGTEVAELITPQLFADFSNPEKRAQVQVEFRKIMAPMQSPEFSNRTEERLKALFTWLTKQPNSSGKAAVVGFCFGGTYAYSLAAAEPDVVAAVPFYGHADHAVEHLKQIHCPILAFYGEQDTTLIDQLPSLVARMDQAGVNFRHKVYTGTGHAFFNDRNPERYNKQAADDAWQLTLSFLDENFKRLGDVVK